MKIELVVFDMAGTTVADNNNVNDAFRGAFEKTGYPVPAEDVNYVMGYRKIEAIKILLSGFHPGEVSNELLIDKIHTQFTNDMLKYYSDTPGVVPLPYAEEVFRKLNANQIKVALNTGFTKVITDTILHRLGWPGKAMIDFVISSDEVEKGRPHPHMIKAIMHELKIMDAGNVVKIGDTEVDINEGRNAGCGMIVSVTTGSYNRRQLETYAPHHIIDSLQELPAILNLS